MQLLIDDRAGHFRFFAGRLRSAAGRMGHALALPPETVVSLVLCPVRTLSRLGLRHFGRGTATDVIAFPTGFDGLPGLLGEIWIAPDMVARNGLAFGKGLNGEFLFVLAHGLLHLLGEDDDTPRRRAAMFQKQEKLLEACRSGQGELPKVIARPGSRGDR